MQCQKRKLIVAPMKCNPETTFMMNEEQMP